MERVEVWSRPRGDAGIGAIFAAIAAAAAAQVRGVDVNRRLVGIPFAALMAWVAW